MIVLGVIVALLFVGLWVAALAYWIVALIEIVRIPDYQFRAAGSEKVMWILVVVLAGIIGALVWRFARRNDVRAAAGYVPPPPPGWYADPWTGGLRWWDGRQWTFTQVPPPPSDRVP